MTLAQWRAQYNSKSSTVQARVDMALDFLRNHYAGNEYKILSEIKCTDFSQEVSLPEIPKGTILVGIKDPRVSPYRGTYFTRVGYSSDRLGISTHGALKSNPVVKEKVQYRYEVMAMIPRGQALQSICAPAADTWSMSGQRILADGGGLQILIPKMNCYLNYIDPSKYRA